MFDAILELVVTTGTNEVSLGISSDPVQTVVVLLVADHLSTDFLEVSAVVLDMDANVVLVLVSNVGLA